MTELAVFGTTTLGTLAGHLPDMALPSAGPARLQNPLAMLLLQVLVIMAVARVLANVLRALHQPRVIGELAAGLILGPSVFERLWPGGFSFMFPDTSLETLRLVGQAGVIMYMFLVGIELNAGDLVRNARSAVAISLFSIVTPFVLGILAAFVLFNGYAPEGVPFTTFALFMGIAMSITAFPVLARILEERGLSATPLGKTALTSAAVGDLSAWILLAFIVATVTAGSSMTFMWTLGFLTAQVLLLTLVVRPLLNRSFNANSTPLTREHMGMVLGLVVASAVATELLGVHALFGAFLAGTVMPAGTAIRQELRDRLEAPVTVVLLPVFLAFTGIRTEVGLLNDATAWGVCAGIVVTAIAGKLIGSMLAARWTGFRWHDAFVMGALMNTRGLMELVALNVAYELGILSRTLFTMFVVMALVTTAMACPLIDLARIVAVRRAERRVREAVRT